LSRSNQSPIFETQLPEDDNFLTLLTLLFKNEQNFGAVAGELALSNIGPCLST